uniref:Uncharacterized protein n=1 Tax=Oryza barthii TaxID=65489 RepID=A0A0D3G696_9ORYZ
MGVLARRWGELAGRLPLPPKPLHPAPVDRDDDAEDGDDEDAILLGIVRRIPCAFDCADHLLSSSPAAAVTPFELAIAPAVCSLFLPLSSSRRPALFPSPAAAVAPAASSPFLPLPPSHWPALSPSPTAPAPPPATSLPSVVVPTRENWERREERKERKNVGPTPFSLTYIPCLAHGLMH